jgi:FtsH-binding integral membrane protein
MPNQTENRPEKSYAWWLAFGLVILLVSQVLSNSSKSWAPYVRWILLLAVLVGYTVVMVRINRIHRAEAMKNTSKNKNNKSKKPKA